jgi:hypothetical protein
MTKALEADNIQSELFQIYGKLKDKCKVFTELAKKYSPYKTQIIEMSQKRHVILEEAEMLMIEFSIEMVDNNEDPARVEFLKKIDLKCDQLNGCYSTVQYGEHFYRQLATHIDQYSQTINDYVMSRKIEKDEILAQSSPQSSIRLTEH